MKGKVEMTKSGVQRTRWLDVTGARENVREELS